MTDNITVTDQQSQNPLVIEKPARKKAPSRGGFRKGAGRKKGAIQKLSGRELLAELEHKLGMTYAQQIAENYYRTIIENDHKLKFEYDKMIMAKVIADKSEVDLTSNGEMLGVTFAFNNVELKEWKE